MGTESFRVSTVIRATPTQIYDAWLDGERHGKMTGGDATGEPVVGSRFTAWGGYISGTNIELAPGRRIVQRWRSTEFPPDAPDSLLEVVLEPDPGGTRLSLSHSEIPEGQGPSYRTGWDDHYFKPMKTYFGRAAATDRPPPSRPVGESAGSDEPVTQRMAPAKKPAAPRKKPSAKRPLAKAAAKKAPARKVAAKKPAAKKAAAKKSPARRTAPKKKSAAKKPPKPAAKKTTRRKR